MSELASVEIRAAPSQGRWKAIEDQCADKAGFLGHVITRAQATELGLCPLNIAKLRLCLMPKKVQDWQAIEQYFGVSLGAFYEPRKAS